MTATAQERIVDKFLRSINEIPQVPHGSASVGALVLAPETAIEMPWYTYLTEPLVGGDLQRAVDETNAVHERLGIPPDPELHGPMQFAWQLTQSVLATSLPPTGQLDVIEPMTSSLALRSSTFLADSGVRAFAHHTLTETEALLRTPAIVKGVGAYKLAILGVSRQFRDNPDVHARLEAMKPHRQSITDLTRPPLMECLHALQADAPTGLVMTDVAHNLTRWDPAPELLRKYFGPPVH